jgi:hypothetical protein
MADTELIVAEKAERDRQEKLAANKRHREKIEREALHSMIASGIEEGWAKEVLDRITQEKIKHITINY